jgi:hypothetical protein
MAKRARGSAPEANRLSAALTRIELPPLKPASLEEIERRRVLVARAKALREEVGPIGTRTDELIHQVREEADGVEW